MVFTASLLSARHSRNVVKGKPVSSLVFLSKPHNGTPHLYVEDRWPTTSEMATLKSEEFHPKDDLICFPVNRK